MKTKEYQRLSNKFEMMIIDFWIDYDVQPEWILKVMFKSMMTYVPRVDEYYENRTNYDYSEKYERIRELWNERDLPVEVINAKIDELINPPEECD